MMINILTDPGCGLTKEELDSLGVIVLPYIIKHGSKTYSTTNGWDTISQEEQLDLFSKGFSPTFSRPSLGEWTPIIENIIKEGNDVLYVAISQKTSNSVSSINIIGNLLKGQYPERYVGCVDTKLAGRGQGYLVKNAVELSKKNLTIEEIERELLLLKDRIEITWLPKSTKTYLECGRAPSSSASLKEETNYVTLTCTSEGDIKPGKFFSSKQEAEKYLVENFKDYSKLEISYTVGTDNSKKFEFKNSDVFHMPPFTSSLLGIDSQEYIFIK